MAVKDKTQLAYRGIKPLIGAEVSASKEALLGGEHGAELSELLERRGVLVFPQIGLSDDEQIAFTKTLGEYAPDLADGGVTPISIDPRTRDIIASITTAPTA